MKVQFNVNFAQVFRLLDNFKELPVNVREGLTMQGDWIHSGDVGLTIRQAVILVRVRKGLRSLTVAEETTPGILPVSITYAADVAKILNLANKLYS